MRVGFSDPLVVKLCWTMPEMKSLQTIVCVLCTAKYALKSTANPVMSARLRCDIKHKLACRYN